MTHQSKVCAMQSDLGALDPQDPIYSMLFPREKIKAVEEKGLYSMAIELTSKCHGSCSYCYASSDECTDIFLSKEKVLGLINEGIELGIKEVWLSGGDPILYPNWHEIISYAKDRGLGVIFFVSGLLSKKQARQISQLEIDVLGTNMETLNQEAYNKVHTEPKTLEAKKEGHYRLLEAGFPSERLCPQMTLSRPVLNTVEECVDWFVDELGVRFIAYEIFRPMGFGRKFAELEPGLSDLKRLFEYRAKKLGSHWLRMGTLDSGGKHVCKTYLGISYTGKVEPCCVIPEYTVGSIHEESLKSIFERSKKEILFDFEVKGPCCRCQHSDICFGCRSLAYSYTGDIQASDPKCYLNPEAPEYVFSDLNK